MQQPDSPVEVLSGTVEGGLHWAAVASGDQAELATMLHVYRGGQQVAGSGFGGPALYRGSVINEWRGRADDLPFFVMARVSPSVDRVIATTAGGDRDCAGDVPANRAFRPALRRGSTTAW